MVQPIGICCFRRSNSIIEDAIRRERNSYLAGRRADSDPPTRSDLHLQFVTLQQFHPNERVRVGFIYDDAPHFAIPNHLGFVNVKEAFAAIGQCASIHALPAHKPRRAITAEGRVSDEVHILCQ